MKTGAYVVYMDTYSLTSFKFIGKHKKNDLLVQVALFIDLYCSFGLILGLWSDHFGWIDILIKLLFGKQACL